MSLPLEGVRDQLLRAGVAPHYARRYVTELREHLADLTERESKAGLDERAARERAREFLGSEAQLASAMIATAPRSLAARAPWAVFVLMPSVVLIAMVALIDLSMMRILASVQATWPNGIPNTHIGLINSARVIGDYLVGPLCAAGCIALAIRQRLISPWVWVGIGFIALFSGCFGFYMQVVSPMGPAGRCAVFSAVPHVWMNGHVNGNATLALIAVRTVTLFSVAAFSLRFIQGRLIGAQG